MTGQNIAFIDAFTIIRRTIATKGRGCYRVELVQEICPTLIPDSAEVHYLLSFDHEVVLSMPLGTDVLKAYEIFESSNAGDLYWMKKQ